MDLAEDFLRRAREQLPQLGIRIVNPEDRCTTSAREVAQQTRACENGGATAIVYLIGTWILANHVLDAARDCRLPIAVWGVPDATAFSSVGANVLHGTFEEIGLKHKLFNGYPEDGEFLSKLRCYLTACNAADKLKKARLGLVGGRSISAYPTMADMNQVKELFGVEIEHIDQMLLMEKARKADEKKMAAVEAYLRQNSDVHVEQEMLQKACSVAVALEEICEEYGLDMVSVKCLGEFINGYTSCCVALAWVNSLGIVAACQCNVNAMLSMYIMRAMGAQDIYFGDVTVSMDGELHFINCGSLPFGLAGKERPQLVEQYDYMGAGKGACTLFCCKAGEMTYGTLGRRKGEYYMNIATGTAYEKPIDQITDVRTWAQGFAQLDGDPEVFYENILCNHTVGCYGNYQAELMEFCHLADVIVQTNQWENSKRKRYYAGK